MQWSNLAIHRKSLGLSNICYISSETISANNTFSTPIGLFQMSQLSCGVDDSHSCWSSLLFYFLEHVPFGERFFCGDLGWDQIAMTCDNFIGGGAATILAIPS